MPKKYLIVAACVAAVFIGGFFTARSLYRKTETETSRPTSQTILLALRGQGFLITQTYLFNQTVDINNTAGSFFKDVLWKQYISASAHVKISSGVDLSKLAAADIQESGGQLTIALPLPTHYSTEIIGAVTVKNTQGVLKKIFDSDDGYNQALTALKTEAEKAAQTPELRQEIQRETEEEIRRLVGLLVPSVSVAVVFK